MVVSLCFGVCSAHYFKIICITNNITVFCGILLHTTFLVWQWFLIESVIVIQLFIRYVPDLHIVYLYLPIYRIFSHGRKNWKHILLRSLWKKLDLAYLLKKQIQSKSYNWYILIFTSQSQSYPYLYLTWITGNVGIDLFGAVLIFTSNW